MSEIYQYDHRSPEELAALIRPQMIGTSEHALDALTALQAQAEFPRYDALRQALRDAQAEADGLRVERNEAVGRERTLRQALEGLGETLGWIAERYPMVLEEMPTELFRRIAVAAAALGEQT